MKIKRTDSNHEKFSRLGSIKFGTIVEHDNQVCHVVYIRELAGKAILISVANGEQVPAKLDDVPTAVYYNATLILEPKNDDA